MENFTFYSPTYFVFGKDTENEAGKYVKRFGGSKVLIHYGGGSVVRSGLLDRVKKSLDGAGISTVERELKRLSLLERSLQLQLQEVKEVRTLLLPRKRECLKEVLQEMP